MVNMFHQQQQQKKKKKKKGRDLDIVKSIETLMFAWR